MQRFLRPNEPVADCRLRKDGRFRWRKLEPSLEPTLDQRTLETTRARR